MTKTKLEKDISSYIGRLLREHFGRGPGNVICSVSGPYVIVHITNFLSPMENSLLASGQKVYVEKTRDLMMDTILKDITSYIEVNTDKQVNEFYYDWDLEAKTGMVLAVLAYPGEDSLPQFDNYPNSSLVHEKINEVSTEAEKPPEKTYSIKINPRQLLIVREGILISIENELIDLGFQETLKIAKRNLEKRLLSKSKPDFENYLEAEMTDYFVDWCFDRNKSYILFNLKPAKK